MALLTSAVVLLIGLWFHRQRDVPVLARRGQEVFTPASAISYILVVVIFWTINVVLAVLQLLTGRTQFETNNAAVAVPGVVLVVACVLVIFRTAHAIDAHDDELSGPIGQLGRFLRVGNGTATVAAFRFARGRTYP